MIRKAEEKDIPEIVTFLERHIDTSMFLLGNLEAHGLNNRTEPHGTSYYLRETGEGITGVFGATNGGLLMCQLPGIGHTEAQTYAHLLQGYAFRGMTGDVDQVRAIVGALPLEGADWRIERDEPLFAMDLARLAAPEVETRAPEAGDTALLTEWFGAYERETGIGDPEDREGHARRADQAIALQNVWLLIEEGAPVAMAAVNAQAGQAVQIGGVYVPDALRGVGRAGAVVAALLDEMKAEGMTRAILFAASDAAAKAYIRIGFERVGDYRLALVKSPVTLGNPR